MRDVNYSVIIYFPFRASNFIDHNIYGLFHSLFSGSSPSKGGRYSSGLCCNLWHLLSTLSRILPMVLLLVSTQPLPMNFLQLAMNE